MKRLKGVGVEVASLSLSVYFVAEKKREVRVCPLNTRTRHQLLVVELCRTSTRTSISISRATSVRQGFSSLLSSPQGINAFKLPGVPSPPCSALIHRNRVQRQS